MAKEDLLEFEGMVLEPLPDARLRGRLDTGPQPLAYASGKINKNRNRLLARDRVTVEMTPYDLTKGQNQLPPQRHGGAASSWRGHNSVVDEVVKSRPELRSTQRHIGQSVKTIDFPSPQRIKSDNNRFDNSSQTRYPILNGFF